MNYAVGIATFAFLFAVTAGAARAQSPADDSLRMMAHWQCAAWAGMARDDVAGEEHFSKGLVSGRRFVEAAQSGAITDAEWDSTVPIGVVLTMAGPSTDFILGRLFAFVSDNAFDQVAKQDAAGQPLAPENYVLDDEVQAVIASNLMRNSNCSVL